MNRLFRIAGLATLCLLAPALAVPADRVDTPGGWLGIKLAGPAKGSSEGVPVLDVFMDSPAQEGGLRARDVIVAVDGAPVHTAGELVARIRSNEPGAWLPLSVLRKGLERDLRVRLEAFPEDLKQLRVLRGWIGVLAIQLPEKLRLHFGAPADAGVMIAEVSPTSPAAAAGFEVGDVVFEVDGEKLASPSDLDRSVSRGGVGNEREFHVARNGVLLVLEARIEASPEP